MFHVQTVSGPIAPDALGHSQIHEHIFVHRTPMAEKNPALRLDDPARSLKELRAYRAAVRLGPPGEHALQQLTAVEVVQALLIQAVDPAVRRVKAQQMVAGRGRHRHAALPRQRAEALCIPSCGHGLGVRQEASPRRPVGAQLLQ